MNSQKQERLSNICHHPSKYVPQVNSIDYWFILGKPQLGASISENREEHLKRLNDICPSPKIKVSARDVLGGLWTKWNFIKDMNPGILGKAYELHRSILSNEIVIESDYTSYAKNLEASKFIGKILEEKGFIPHYYYGGNKSLHIHIFLDMDYILECEDSILQQMKEFFHDSRQFTDTFIVWLREQIIVKWPCKIYWFDDQLIKNAHLIRSELSLNKLGYKTFLGYAQSKLPSEPYICNPQTTNYPEIATCDDPDGNTKHPLKLSKPKEISKLVSQFLHDYRIILSKKVNVGILNRNYTYSNHIRKPIDFMLGDTFKEAPDGFKRAMFLIINELLRYHPKEDVREIMIDWNVRMEEPVLQKDIDFRVNSNKRYNMSNTYLFDFLSELGFKKQEVISAKKFLNR